MKILTWVGGGLCVAAIAAAVVVPNMLAATISTCGTTPVAHMVSLVNAQATFKRQKWYKNSGKGFANGARDLYELTSNPGTKPQLISKAFADAFGTTPEQMVSPSKEGKDPIAGYVFIDISRKPDGVTPVDLTDPSEPITHIAYCAIPYEYDKTGRQTYICEMSGTVYGKDMGGKAVTEFPRPLTGWEPAGD